MESKLFSIGDIVGLKTHPYLKNSTDIVISGDHLTLPPLLVVTEVYREKQKAIGKECHLETFKYKCLYFSVKQYRFVELSASESDLKLIVSTASTIYAPSLKRGDTIALKCAPLEMGKRKSSLSYQDDLGVGKSSTTINALLSYLSPVMQVVNIGKHNSKSPVRTKTGMEIRQVPVWDLTLSYFDPSSDKVSEFTFPLEAFELIPDVDMDLIDLVSTTIENEAYLTLLSGGKPSLVKPVNVNNRAGKYFLRAYDYLLNKIGEFPIVNESEFKISPKPFVNQVPTFDILKNPSSATPEYILNEIGMAINDSARDRCCIRIRYKNRNDQISFRTVTNFQLVKVKEGALEVNYLLGFCLLRQANRNFRVDRIQSLQQLTISY
jgi:hypothetical protein